MMVMMVMVLIIECILANRYVCACFIPAGRPSSEPISPEYEKSIMRNILQCRMKSPIRCA